MPLFYFISPAKSIRQFAPLNTGKGVIELLGNRADFTVVDAHDLIAPFEFADGRDYRSRAAAECFFQFACYLSAELLGVNPFDQPGVEAYKGWMFRALGKPGA